MTSANNRIGYIATARLVGILLVLFGHSYPFDVYISPSVWKIQSFIYTFHMPLFLFLSGYLLTYSTRPPESYIRHRAIRLLVPYFVLSVAAYIPKAMVQQFLNDSVEISLWYLIKTELIPRDNVWGHFWYIPVVFFLCSFGILLLKLLRNHPIAGWAALVVTYLLLYAPPTTDLFALEDLRKTAFYFVLGMITAELNPKVHFFSSRFWLLAFPGAVSLFALLRTTLTYSVIACLMIGFTLHIGSVLPLPEKGLLSTIEKYSFTVFLLSWPAQAVVEVICNKLLHLPVFATMGSMFLSGIVVPLICVNIVSWLDKRIQVKWIKLAIGM